MRRFAEWLVKSFDIVVWSSAQMHNTKLLVDHIFGDAACKLLHIMGQSDCERDGIIVVRDDDPGSARPSRQKPRFLKPLKAVWANVGEGRTIDERTTLLIDDSPYKAVRNPDYTAIHPIEYTPNDAQDVALRPGGSLRKYLEALRRTPTDVPGYVAANPFRDEVPPAKPTEAAAVATTAPDTPPNAKSAGGAVDDQAVGDGLALKTV